MANTCIVQHTPYLAARHKELVDSGVPDKEAAIKVAIEEHKKLHDELNDFKKSISPDPKKFKPTEYVSPDTSEKVKEIRDAYNAKIKEAKKEKKAPEEKATEGINEGVGNQESAGQAEEKIKAAQSEVDRAKSALKKAEDNFAGAQAQQGNLLGGNEVQKDLFANNPQEVKNVLDPLKQKVREAEANLEEVKKSIGTDNGQPNLFSIQSPTTQEISDMKDIVKDYVDEGTASLQDIQNDVAKELGDSSQQMRDLVEKAYNEFTKTTDFAPKEVTGGVIGRVGKFLSRLFGGTAASKVFILKGEKALMDKANSLSNVSFMNSPNGKVLGFSHEGKIYLNGEQLNTNTPIHEAGGHIFLEWAKLNNEEVYKRGMQLVENSKYLKEVRNNEFYKAEASKLGSETSKAYSDYMKHEALAMAIGDKGAQFVGETRKKDFKEWLNNLWTKIKEAAGFKDISADELQNLTFDEFTKRAAADILRDEEITQPQNQQQGTGTAAAPQPKNNNADNSEDDFLKAFDLRTSPNLSDNASIATLKKNGYSPEMMDTKEKVEALDLDLRRDDANDIVQKAKEVWGDDITVWGKKLYQKALGLVGLDKTLDAGNATGEKQLITLVKLRKELNNAMNDLTNQINFSEDKVEQQNLKNERAKVQNIQVQVNAAVEKLGNNASRKLNLLRIEKSFEGATLVKNIRNKITGEQISNEFDKVNEAIKEEIGVEETVQSVEEKNTEIEEELNDETKSKKRTVSKKAKKKAQKNKTSMDSIKALAANIKKDLIDPITPCT